MAQLGRNTPNGERLIAIIERVEYLRERKKEIAADEAAVMAEAVAEGFNSKVIRALIKRRSEKPHDRQEFDTLLDVYSHAVGMDAEAPLFRAVGLMAVDTAARDQVIEAFKRLVPDGGEIIVKAGDQPVRLWRDKDGTVHASDWQEAKAPPAGGAGALAPARPAQSAPSKPDVPPCSDDEAGQMGQAAFRDNQPVTSNPFPHDDKRRRLWDRGWRDASGTDGMGPAPQKGEEDAPDPEPAAKPAPEPAGSAKRAAGKAKPAAGKKAAAKPDSGKAPK